MAIEPNISIAPNLDLVLHDELGVEVFRSPGVSNETLELKTTIKPTTLVWASPTLTSGEQEMFETITSSGQIIHPYLHGDYGHVNIPSYFSRATKVLDPRQPDKEYIASAFLILNQEGKLVAYDPENIPLNQWVREQNKGRHNKGEQFPVLSGVCFDKRGNPSPIEVVEPMGAYSLGEATDKITFTQRMREILPDFIILPDCKAIAQVTLPNGDLVYQLLYQRPRSFSLDSIAATALSSRAIRRLHSTRIMQTAIAVKEMIAHNTIHLSLHTGNRQLSIDNNQLRVYIGDWDEMIALSDWSNKKHDKRAAGFVGRTLAFKAAEGRHEDEYIRNFAPNVGLTPRQIVIMYGIQRFIHTETLGALRMMSMENIPAEKVIPEVLNTTIDMLLLAFAQNTEQRTRYGAFREKLLAEVLKLSPTGTMTPSKDPGDSWYFISMAIAMVITKWFYPAENEPIAPGDSINVSPARAQAPPPSRLPSGTAPSNALVNKASLRRLKR